MPLVGKGIKGIGKRHQMQLVPKNSPEIFVKSFNINWLIINITLETIRSCLFLNCFLIMPFWGKVKRTAFIAVVGLITIVKE